MEYEQLERCYNIVLKQRDKAEAKIAELECRICELHTVLEGVYDSGVKLDEHDNIVRKALGLHVF